MVKVIQRDFNEHHIIKNPSTEKQLGTMQIIEEVTEYVEKNYPEIPDSMFVAQPVDDFLFPWEGEGSAEIPITIDENGSFSETMTPQDIPPQQPLPALRSIESLQNSSAGRELFKWFFSNNCCLVSTLFFVFNCVASSNLFEWKMKLKLITPKSGLNQQRLFQMFDLICAGFILFICNVILYRFFKIFTTACKIDPH